MSVQRRERHDRESWDCNSEDAAKIPKRKHDVPPVIAWPGLIRRAEAAAPTGLAGCMEVTA